MQLRLKGMPDKIDWDAVDRYVEILSAILIAFATVLSAWCAYQSARWGGVQAISMAEAAAYRIKATNYYNEGNRELAVQVQLFSDYLAARTGGNTGLADFLQTRFPPPLKESFALWLQTEPFENTDAPLHPFQLPEYQLETIKRGNELSKEADDKMAHAEVANQRSDNYILLTVIFASVLFFGGIGTKFQQRKVRIATVSIGCVVFIAAGLILLRFPVH